MAEGAGVTSQNIRGHIKIVAVAPPPTTGMTHVTECMTRAISETGPTVTYLVSRHAGESDTSWSLRKHYTLIVRMLQAIAEHPLRAPIYVVLDSGAGAWGTVTMALATRLRGAKLIVHHHVFRYFTKPTRAARAFFRLAGPDVRHIVLCDCMANRLHEHFGSHLRTSTLSNAGFVDPLITRSPRSSLRRIGFIGNVTRDKGIGLFMDTVRCLAAAGAPVEADIAGPVRDAALAEEIAAFTAEDPARRRTLGPVYGEDKAAFFKSIDALLFPSQYVNEAQPVTIYEALAAGLPVLATGRGCIGEQLPPEWVFAETDFVERSAERIALWRDAPEAFDAAATQAGDLWDASLAKSRAELDALLAEIEALTRQPYGD